MLKSQINTVIHKWKNSLGFKSTILLIVMGGLSQLLGMLRDILMADKIGVGQTLDMYYASFRVADFIYASLLSIVAGVTIIPLISKSIHDKNWVELSHRYSSIFNFFSIITFLLCGLAYIFMPEIIGLIFSHTDSEWQYKVSFFSQIMLVQAILLNLSNIFATLAMAENRFMTYAVAPLFYNIGIIFGVIVLYDKYGERGLIWGVILGAAMHVAVQSYSFFRSKVKLKLFVIDWKIIKEELALAIPRSFSLVMLQVRAIFIASMSTALGVGVLTTYTFANNFFMIPAMAIGVSFITVAFPKLSALYESHHIEDFYKRVYRDTELLMLMSVPVAILFYFGSNIIVSVIYPHINHKEEVSMLLSSLSITLPLYVLSLYYIRASFARRDALSPLISQSAAVAIVIIAMYILLKNNFGLLSIPYAFNLSLFVEFFLIYFLFHYKESKE